MKTVTLISVLLFIALLNCKSQSLSPTVISSFGGSDQTSGTSWTLGECLIQTMDNGQNILTQGFHYDSCFCTIITKNEKEELFFQVFPNPAADFIKIICQTGTTQSIHLSIFSIEGKVLLHDTFNDSEKVINVAYLPSGLYLIKLELEDQKIFTSKFYKN